MDDSEIPPFDPDDRDAMARLASYLEKFSARDFAPGQWRGRQYSEDPPVYQMPWVDHSPEVDAFVQLAYQVGWARFPFDWNEWAESVEGQRLIDRPEALGMASVDQLSKLLTTIIRNDRFCEGYLASQFDNGVIVALLQRLKFLSKLP